LLRAPAVSNAEALPTPLDVVGHHFRSDVGAIIVLQKLRGTRIERAVK
jgi:hypothetical protein